MGQVDLHNFIYFMVNNKSLSRAQKNKVGKLIERQILNGNNNYLGESNEALPVSQKFSSLSPLSTFKFLAGFNDPLRLKYLTHDFDYDMDDNRPTSWSELITQIINIWKQQQKFKTLPRSLSLLFDNFIFGYSSWLDMYGEKHHSFLQNSEVINWCSENKCHPLLNEEFNKEIQSFKDATRIRNTLDNLVAQISRSSGLLITTRKLAAADFYTNTLVVFSALKRIIEQTMKPYSNEHPEISVNFSRENCNGHRFQVITISQKGSFAKNNINQAIERLENSSTAGDFGSIRQLLNGYCLWSVESLWDGEAKRWNILREPQDDKPLAECEDISSPENVVGFVHTLKFYQS